MMEKNMHSSILMNLCMSHYISPIIEKILLIEQEVRRLATERKQLKELVLIVLFFMITLIKKHFCVIVVKIKEPDLFSQSVTVNDDIRHRTSIKARINKYELYSPRYGSKTNPIPVLDFDYNLREPRDQYDEEEYESLFSRSAYYKRAVELYLTYMMSKEEFKERFEKE